MRAIGGAIGLIAASRPKIFTEYCPELIRHVSGASATELLILLAKYGYTIEILHRSAARELLSHLTIDDAIRHVESTWKQVSLKGGTHL